MHYTVIDRYIYVLYTTSQYVNKWTYPVAACKTSKTGLDAPVAGNKLFLRCSGLLLGISPSSLALTMPSPSAMIPHFHYGIHHPIAHFNNSALGLSPSRSPHSAVPMCAPLPRLG